MKLQRKIHLYSSVLFIVLIIAANVTIYALFSRMSVGRELEQFAAETERASAAIGQAESQAAITGLLRAYVPLNGMIRVVKEDEPSNMLLVTSSSATRLSGVETQYNDRKLLQLTEHEGQRYGFVSVPVIAADGEVINVQAMQSMEELMQLLGMLRLVMFAATAVVIVAVLISSGILGSLIMRPISAMTRTMREVARSGRFVRLKLDARPKDELGQMGETFNEMIGLLESSFEKQEQFVSNASHELKTPLTIIESYASLLKRKGLERPDLFEESVEAIHSEAVRMRSMTEQLLLLAKPKHEWKMEWQTVQAAEFVERTVTAFRRAYKRDIEVSIAASPTVRTDPGLLKQLLFILLDNARKYSGDTIIVHVEDGERDTCVIRVEDRGVGISREDLPRVFERFYRVDQARSKTQEEEGGTGLGLSLAVGIAEAIGGTVALDSTLGVGTVASITLPLDSARSQQTLMRPAYDGTKSEQGG